MSDDPGVLLRASSPRGCLNLRGNPRDTGFRNAVANATGVELPVEPRTWRFAGDTAVYWLGPDEWLIVAGSDTEADLEQRLRTTLEGPFSIVDTSGANCFLNLSGPAVGYVLQKSSPYDFHPRSFPAGRCVQTVFAKASAVVAANSEGSVDVVVRRSYADYVHDWIADAAAEYGFARR
ncbi:MAG: sarcosine oxidase, gamma subunit family protein [Gammaproteobacteria bacterium]|nr:sarcosine oxidase, gamma subunit family protein [Gammaproteobacteria bacterium]